MPIPDGYESFENDPVPVPDDMFKSRYSPNTGSLWPSLQMGNSRKLEVVLVVVVILVVVHLLTKIFAGKVCRSPFWTMIVRVAKLGKGEYCVQI
jgi:hypothetical protein